MTPLGNFVRSSCILHAFARFDASVDEFLGRYGSNHIHAIPGDHVKELRTMCRLLDIDYDGFGGAI